MIITSPTDICICCLLNFSTINLFEMVIPSKSGSSTADLDSRSLVLEYVDIVRHCIIKQLTDSSDCYCTFIFVFVLCISMLRKLG